MAGEKKIDKSELVAAVLKSDPSTQVAGQDVASGKGGTPTVLSSSISSSGDAISSMKGYNGTFTQLDDHNYFNAGGGSHFSTQGTCFCP
ncbi:unnamed protein product [Camellia sinensis]